MADHIHQPGEVFVFGANRAGKHGGGAARHAWKELDAKWGVGEGRTGKCYALPTMDAGLNPLPLQEVAKHAETFRLHAVLHPETAFFLTAVGTGIAGFTVAQIALLFAGCPDNVRMPPSFLAVLEGRHR